MKIGVDLENSTISKSEIENKRNAAHQKFQDIWQKKLPYCGWVDYPARIPASLIQEITDVAEKIRQESDIFLVLGAGGSFMGAKAVIDMLESPESKVEIIFAGYNFSARYVREIIHRMENKEVSLCVISKSGTTMETLTAYSIFEEWMKERYGAEASNRTYVITENTSNYLREKAEGENIRCFDLEKEIGGRYSVMTPVGLLPIAVAGIDVKKFIAGAAEMVSEDAFTGENLDYAIARQELYHAGKNVEVFESFDPYFSYFGEWLKQLFGESEGKEGKGILPYTMTFSRDLHSMGQFLQQGTPCFFETLLSVDTVEEGEQSDYRVPDSALNSLAGKMLNQINKCAERGVFDAHVKSGIPLVEISIPEQNPYYIGMLMYYFEVQCAVSALLAGVCPFDQPGVEAYKKETRTHIQALDVEKGIEK